MLWRIFFIVYCVHLFYENSDSTINLQFPGSLSVLLCGPMMSSSHGFRMPWFQFRTLLFAAMNIDYDYIMVPIVYSTQRI